LLFLNELVKPAVEDVARLVLMESEGCRYWVGNGGGKNTVTS